MSNFGSRLGICNTAKIQIASGDPMQYRTDTGVDYTTANSFYRYLKAKMVLVGMTHSVG